MRRFIAFITAMIILSASLSSGTFAEEPSSVLSIESASYSYRLKEITVSLTAQNIDPFNSIEGTLFHDSRLIFLSMSVHGEDYGEYTPTPSEIEGEDSSVSFKLTYDEPFTIPEDGVIADLTFALSENAEPGDVYQLYFGEESVLADFGVPESAVQINTESGTLSVNDTVIYGDVNGDGVTNLKDVTIMIRRLAKYDVEMDVVCADVNLDDKVNLVDVTIMIRNLAGWNDVRMGHRDKTEILAESTCQDPGQIRLTCGICGDSETVDTARSGHDYVLGKCSVCGEKSIDYPLLTYNNYIRNHAKHDENLRGYALYETVKHDGYRMFVSNIYDSEADSLCLFGTAFFESGLTSTFSIDIKSVSEDGVYPVYYDCSYDGEVLASFTGQVGSSYSDIEITNYTGAEDEIKSHQSIAAAISAECFNYTAELLGVSGLDVSVEDFNITTNNLRTISE